MFCNLKNYKINGYSDEIYNILLNGCLTNEENMSFLLNKKVNNIVEKIVFDIATFHLNNMNMVLDESKFVEFWFKENDQPCKLLHIDCDEYDRQINNSSNYSVPLVSCITYLNDNSHIPTIITNIDSEKYKYKDFAYDDMQICLSFPKKWKHICFNGGKFYHGACKLFPKIDSNNLQDFKSIEISKTNNTRNLFLINIWDKKPLNVPYFNPEYFFYKCSMLLKNEIQSLSYSTNISLNMEETINDNTHIKSNVLSEDFFEKLFYKDYSNDIFKDICEKLECNSNNDIVIFSNSDINSINTAVNNNRIPIDLTKPKFSQRFIINKHFTRDICKWIINESEEYASLNGGWNTNRHKNYPTTDLPVEKIQNIFRFILTSFSETINKIIINSYQLKKDYNNIEFDFKDIFIVKYEMGQQEFLTMHTDASMITVNILLSDTSEFTDGGTFFEDELISCLETGDMLIHNSNTRHSGLPITSGKRYLLVFFIDIFVTKNT
jgi:hypothetical protein